MLHAVAIDDEPLALEVLKSHARQLDFILIDKTFTNALKGLEYLQKNKADVLFLDIKMPDKNGLDVATLLPKNIQVIFTTAYAQYAVNGFELNATDYLLKPISLIRFTQACNKAKKQQENIKDEDNLIIKENGAWHKIPAEQVLYVESQGNYLKLVTRNRNYLVRQTLYELEKQLPSYFARTHKSFVINTRHIDRIEPHQVSIGFTAIPVSETYKKELFNILGLKN